MRNLKGRPALGAAIAELPAPKIN
jgi:hypothetical protein